MKRNISLSNQCNPNERNIELERKELQSALERNEFFLHYQPKLSLASGKIIGIEALIRWNHPEKGIISPAEFIPLAEESGLIIPIGEWVMRTACLQNKAWQESGLPPIVISVNLSVRQFFQPELAGMVRGILYETELAPEFLELEITESMLMDIQHGIHVLRELKSLGVQLSLDDFGTGYSSLLHLKELPIDKLKIDQSFIRNCTEDDKDATIVKTIIAMAHQLKLTVLAEGVETKDHLVFLQRNLCNEAQGYFFSKPMHPEQIIQKYDEIEQIIVQDGIPKKLSNQKWLEEELQLARQELAETIRQQQGMTFKYIKKDGEFIHTLCDGELLYRMGLLPEDVIGRKLSDFLSGNVLRGTFYYYQKAWKGEEHVTYEGELNGINTIISLRPIRSSGKVVAVIGSCVDTTEKKQIEEALKQSESKYRLITENMTDFVSICELDGRITYASPSHHVIAGFSIMNQQNTANSWVHPDDIGRIQIQFDYTISNKNPSQIEFRVKHVNGHWMFIEARISPVIGNDGEVEYLVVVSRDITERKKIEKLMKKTERLSVAGQLAAGIAHEIRNPLTTVKGFLQMMKPEFDKVNYFDIMLTEISHVEKIIDEFLSLAKSQVNKTMKTDIIKLLQQVTSLMGTQAILKNIEIIQQVDPELPRIDCDEHQIRQVFIHILQNAFDAMQDGGVITIQAEKHELNNIRFRIIDTGCGITEDRMTSIFEPFYSTNEKGTGLGLMICHKIIQGHGGTIQIDSKINEGTIVDFVLPIKI